MRHKRDGLHSKVIDIRPFQDYNGRFISYCDFNGHRGVVLKPNVCEHRQCEYYHKFYIDKEQQNGR
jgi:hypothetical protein